MVVSCVETEVKGLVQQAMDITFLVGEEGDRRIVLVVGWLDRLELVSRLETFKLAKLARLYRYSRSITIFV